MRGLEVVAQVIGRLRLGVRRREELELAGEDKVFRLWNSAGRRNA